MIRIMLVAGSNSRNLASFLKERGTFEADFVYNDLHSNITELMHKVIKVDKFIYVYKDGGESNVRLDMQSLQEMLKNNKFFSAKEFLFLCADSDKLGVQAKSYFQTVMDSCCVAGYAIRSIDSIASFSSIYDNLIGITVDRDFKNTYRTLYRKHRGDESNTAYEPKVDRQLVIEPFDYKKINDWDEQKRLIASVEQHEPLFDSDTNTIARWKNPDLGALRADEVFTGTQFMLVSGFGYSGKSVWASQLASSAIKNGKRCVVFDLTERHSIEKLPHGLKEISPWEAIRRTELPEGDYLCIVNCSQIREYLSFVAKQNIFDLAIVLADFEQAEIVCNSLRCQLVLVTSFTRETYVERVRRLFEGVICPKFFAISWNDREEVGMAEVKKRLGDAIVIGKYEFADYRSNEWLFKKITARGGNG